MDTQIDQDALNLAKAIRQTETGGSKDPYNTKGASGEFGGYQFMPATYKALAKQHLGDENAEPTVENQNRIAYMEIKRLKDAGKTPAEIASYWNSGRTNAYKQDSKGKNSLGVSYDVPAYVAKVSKNYLEFKNGSIQKQQPQTVPDQRAQLQAEGQPVSINPQKVGPSKVGQIIRGALHLPASIIASGANAVQAVQGKPMTEAFHNSYLGDVKRVGSTFDPAQGFTKNNVTAIKDAAGKGLELASYAVGGGAASGIKDATLAGKVLRGAGSAAKSGLGAGALAGAGSGLQLDKGLGGTLASAGIGAAAGGLLGGLTGGVLPVFGKGVNALLGKGDKVLRDDAIASTTKALGVFGKKSGKIAMAEPRKMAEGLSVVRKYAKNFDPKNSENIFDDTLKAWTEARDNVFQKYDSVAKQAGDNGAKIDTAPLKSFLEKYTEGISTAPKRARAQRLLAELKKNFPKNTAEPLEMQNYVKLLNEELGGLTGGAEKGATGVTADFVKLAREHLDEAITKSTGKEYQTVRNEYSALKSVEDGLVRQYQKVMRKKGSGLADYADMISNADVLSGIVSGNPALLVKGVATRLGSKFIKSLNDPATHLKDAFGAIDKIHAKLSLPSRSASPKILPKRVDSIRLP